MQTLLRVGIAACLTLLSSWQGFAQIPVTGAGHALAIERANNRVA